MLLPSAAKAGILSLCQFCFWLGGRALFTMCHTGTEQSTSRDLLNAHRYSMRWIQLLFQFYRSRKQSTGRQSEPFPRSHRRMVNVPGAENQFCLNTKLILFLYRRAFLIRFLLFFIVSFFSSQKPSAFRCPSLFGGTRTSVLEVF